ncbi:hypothetical protein KDL29_10810 [bacterium]|nr:hypothetical protein [bacterium]
MISQRDLVQQQRICVSYPSRIAREYSELLQRLSELLRPVLDLVYTCRPETLEDELERLAQRAWQSGMARQYERVLRVSLLSIEMQARMDLSGNAPSQLQLRMILDMLERRSPELVCDLLLTRELLLWRLIADNHGVIPLSRAELSVLLGRLDGLMEDRQLWHVLAMWAFMHHDHELMVRAAELFLVHPGASLNQALWQRVNLMYLLLEGRATRRDVLETLRVLSVHPQVEEFRRNILPACIAAGIADVEVMRLLDERIAELRSQGYEWRGNEARTKSLRTLTI